MREDEGTSVLLVALDTALMTEFQVADLGSGAVGVVTVGTTHPAFRHGMVMGHFELGSRSLVATRAATLSIFAGLADAAGWRMACQAGDLVSLVLTESSVAEAVILAVALAAGLHLLLSVRIAHALDEFDASAALGVFAGAVVACATAHCERSVEPTERVMVGSVQRFMGGSVQVGFVQDVEGRGVARYAISVGAT